MNAIAFLQPVRRALAGGRARFFVFLVAGVVVFVVVTEKQWFWSKYEWGAWRRPAPTIGQNVRWQNTTNLGLKAADEAQVLIKLLEQDREEARFWQGRLFEWSYWFNLAIFAIVAYTLGKREERGRNTALRAASMGACVLIAVFYLVFIDFAEGAIAVNHDDLVGIQYGLKLSVRNEYLANDQVIYQAGDYGPESHIKTLVRFHAAIVLLAALVLWFLPSPNARERENGPRPERGTSS